MAQIIITTIDQKNGALSVTFSLKDSAVERIYNAHKYVSAQEYLADKQREGQILEASDTIDNVIAQLASQDILEHIANRFVEDLCRHTYTTESNIEYSKIYAKIEKIAIES